MQKRFQPYICKSDKKYNNNCNGDDDDGEGGDRAKRRLPCRHQQRR